MKPQVEPDVVWLPVSTFAAEYNKTARTITRWSINGFILTLGYRVKRDETGHWLVGVPKQEYCRWQSRNPELVA